MLEGATKGGREGNVQGPLKGGFPNQLLIPKLSQLSGLLLTEMEPDTKLAANPAKGAVRRWIGRPDRSSCQSPSLGQFLNSDFDFQNIVNLSPPRASKGPSVGRLILKKQPLRKCFV